MASPKNIFLILDGHAILHRAWHALPPMTTKDGLVTHGAYGFTTIMLNAIKQFKPTYMAVAFDLSGPTFRHEAYDEYKATREKKPDELYAQVDSIQKVLDAMNVPVFTAKGYEADDVLGTLSLLAPKQDKNVETIIVTGDMDTLQLVDDHTRVYTMRKGMSDTVIYDEAAVFARFGFKPMQLIDYKALRGDPSDNIPGVRGIGEKTGSELIATFGSVPKLYESLEKNDAKAKGLRESVREKLLTHRADAMSALDLCRIRRDVPLDFVLKNTGFAFPTREQMTSVFTELEFMKLLKTLPEGTPAAAASAATNATASLFGAATETKKTRAKKSDKAISEATVAAITEAVALSHPDVVVEVRDIKSLTAAVSSLSKAKAFAFHFVSDNDPYAPAVAALGLADDKKVYVLSRTMVEDGKPLLAKLFASDAQKVCHDLKRELKVFAALDVKVTDHFFDLMIASYLLHSGERRHALSAILAYERGVQLEDDAVTQEEQTYRLGHELPHFLPLAKTFGAELKEHDMTKLNTEIEIPLTHVLAQMERNGIAVDVPYFKKLAAEVGGELEKLTKSIHKHAGEEFNIQSPAQMKVVLFEKLGLSSEGLKKTTKGKELSTAAAELEKLRHLHPIIDEILKYRELAKLQSTYIESLPLQVSPKTGRIHAEFNQTVAATGRLSSANPNMQNIPTPETEYGKRTRNGFVATKGYVLVAADYSQIELRIAADIANEKTFIAAFKNGEDIHYRTAVEMFGEDQAKSMRRVAKAINFGILYGMGPNRLSDTTGVSFQDARTYIEKYFAIHKGIEKYMTETKKQVEKLGYVETLFGRKRFFKNVKFMNPREKAEAERQAINAPIQGSNADMIKVAMVRIQEMLEKKYGSGAEARARMLLQVHDELVFEVRAADVDAFVADIQPLMENVRKLAVPVVVNVATGARWGEMDKK